MDKLKKRIKELELAIANMQQDITRQLGLNNKQSEYNVHIANNMTALGQKVFPEQFKEVDPKDEPGGVEIKTGPDRKESNIITP